MGTSTKILIVDDKKINRELLKGYLVNAGYSQILQAGSGEEALEQAEKEKPDLVLLDIVMPGIDGYEVCRRLKANEQLKDIPVIFLSALTDTTDKIKAFAQGGVDYIAKPFAFEEVQARVQTHLKIYSLQRDLEKHNKHLQQLVKEQKALYRQLDEEFNKARRIHERILPDTLPQVEGISFAAHYQPAKKVGGDFYDAIRKDNKLVIYLSDVTGHGLEGALFSVFVKEAIESYVSLKCDELKPEKILEHLRKQYHQAKYPDDYFVCLFLAVLDLETMDLSYTGVGFQEAPRAYLGKGQHKALPSQGLPISSAFPQELLDFRESIITLFPGTTILFNTDGLTEQTVLEKTYYRRLDKVFKENCHLPPEVILHAINEDFRQFNNGSLQGDDDITFLVMQVEPHEKKVIQFELASELGELDRMREKAISVLPESDKSVIFINSLHEVAANAVEHGNKMDPEKTVFVDITVTEEYIQAMVQDQGEGFNWHDKIDKFPEMEGNQERGRGIAMTRMSCDWFFYNDKGNRATIVISYS